MRCAALVLTATLLAISARAGELSGITLPDQITVEEKTLVLNGMGLRKAYGVAKVYVAGLYLESRSTDSGAILGSEGTRRLVLKFLRDVGREDITKAWTEGFEKNAGDRLGALKERITTFNSWMPEFKEGDALVFTAVPGKGTFVDINGSAKGTIPGADFASALLAIWLGPSPPNAALKEGLLRGK